MKLDTSTWPPRQIGAGRLRFGLLPGEAKNLALMRRIYLDEDGSSSRTAYSLNAAGIPARFKKGWSAYTIKIIMENWADIYQPIIDSAIDHNIDL